VADEGQPRRTHALHADRQRLARRPRHGARQNLAAALPELRRRAPEHGAEGAGERFVRPVAGGEGDVGDRIGGVPQPTRRALQAQPPQVLLDGLAHHAGEDAVEMVGRKRGHRGQLV